MQTDLAKLDFHSCVAVLVGQLQHHLVAAYEKSLLDLGQEMKYLSKSALPRDILQVSQPGEYPPLLDEINGRKLSRAPATKRAKSEASSASDLRLACLPRASRSRPKPRTPRQHTPAGSPRTARTPLGSSRNHANSRTHSPSRLQGKTPRSPERILQTEATHASADTVIIPVSDASTDCRHDCASTLPYESGAPRSAGNTEHFDTEWGAENIEQVSAAAVLTMAHQVESSSCSPSGTKLPSFLRAVAKRMETLESRSNGLEEGSPKHTESNASDLQDCEEHSEQSFDPSMIRQESPSSVRSGSGRPRKNSLSGVLTLGTSERSLEKPPLLTRFVMHPFFETTFALLIVANALIMGAEQQYLGIDVGFILGYPGSASGAEKTWPAAMDVFDVLGWIFGILFTFEVAVKIGGFGFRFFLDPWSWIDTTIVAIWIFSQLLGDVLPVNAQLIRVARLSRLLRVLRLFRTIHGFDDLYLMTTAIRQSASVLGWACCLLFLGQMMMALLVSQVLHEVYFLDAAKTLEQRRDVYEYFGTFTRAMLSMFEITLANWPPVCRLLSENVSEWFMLFCLIHKLTMGFAVLGVVNGVFMQETFKAASLDDRIMLKQKEATSVAFARKMQLFLDEADMDSDGQLSLEELQRVVSNPVIKMWLAAMDLDTKDTRQIFKLIDRDKDGYISLNELVDGVAHLKGPAKSLDLSTLLQEHRELMHKVAHGNRAHCKS